MSTTEIIRDASTSSTQTVVQLNAETVQGTSQEYGTTTNSLKVPTPIFFAPQQKEDLSTYWGILLQGTVRSFYTLFSPPKTVSTVWDRLNLDLMRIGSLLSNWDGEGASAIAPETIKNAGILLQLAQLASERIGSVDCTLPVITPSVDGSVILKWVHRDKELKCTVLGGTVEVVKWQSLEAYESDGLWEIPVSHVSEHFAWLLQ